MSSTSITPYKVGDVVFSLVIQKSCVVTALHWVGYDELRENRSVLYRCVDALTTDEFTAYPYELRPIESSGDFKYQPTMNIAEILKNAPKETKLYSPLIGEVTLRRIDNDNHLIILNDENYHEVSFTADGRYSADYPNSECLLFPSKDNRDWSTFKVEPQFPTSYEDCCEILGVKSIAERRLDLVQYPTNIGDSASYSCEFPYHIELNALFKLLICRDAWWKVDNDWKPDWKENSYKYIINTCKNTIDIGVAIDNNNILAFRTPKIRNKFLDTFRDLIMKCKELI